MAANPPPPVEVWPCHWKTVKLFRGMLRQWRVSFNGPIGLDMTALPVVAAAVGVPVTRRRFADLEVMAGEALRQLRR